MKRFLIFSLTAMIISNLIFNFNSAAAATVTPKIAGSDRIETAIKASQRTFSAGRTSKVVLVNGWTSADLISAISLAKKENAPILLSRPTTLDSRNLQEINRLGAKKVFIVGGTSVVSSQIQANLRNRGLTVIRFDGRNRYQTNQKINDYVFGNSTKAVDQVMIVNGQSETDALAGAAYAYQKNIPIILSDSAGTVATQALKNYRYRQAIILGNTSSLSSKLDKIARSTRISGADRYQLSWNTHRKLFSGRTKAIIATGETAADVIGSLSLAQNGSNIVLVKNSIFDLPTDIFTQRTLIVGGSIKNETAYPWLANLNDGDTVAIYVNPHQDDEALAMGLQLVRDTNARKKVLLMQMTRGNKSVARDRVNKLLVLDRKRPLTVNQFSDARTRETKDVINRLGFSSNHVIEYQYSDQALTSSQVTNELIKLTNTLKGKRIELRTTANLSTDISKGARDHRACADGTRNFVNRYSPQTTATYFLSPDNKPTSNFYKSYPSSAEKSKWFSLFKSFEVWSPKDGRYSIGKLSASSTFEKVKAAGYIFVQK